MPGRKAGSNNGEEDRKAEGSFRQAVRRAGIMGRRTGRRKEAFVRQKDEQELWGGGQEGRKLKSRGIQE